jgi:hypothetical protein
VLETLAIKGKNILTTIIPSVKSKLRKLNKLRIKNEVLSKTKVKPRCLLGLSSWQKRNLQKLSAQELKERSRAWVSKGSMQEQSMDDIQSKGATGVTEKRKTKR